MHILKIICIYDNENIKVYNWVHIIWIRKENNASSLGSLCSFSTASLSCLTHSSFNPQQWGNHYSELDLLFCTFCWSYTNPYIFNNLVLYVSEIYKNAINQYKIFWSAFFTNIMLWVRSWLKCVAVAHSFTLLLKGLVCNVMENKWTKIWVNCMISTPLTQTMWLNWTQRKNVGANEHCI